VKKKLMALLMSTMMVGSVLMTGCSTVSTEEAGETSADAEDETTTDTFKGDGDKTINILLYMQEHEKKIYSGLIEDFVEEHKDEIKEVNFEVTTQDEYGTKMTANMTAGDMPDIFYVGPDSVRSYVDNGYVLPFYDSPIRDA
jgi:multiple sugar transport system substrate-binding protein